MPRFPTNKPMHTGLDGGCRCCYPSDFLMCHIYRLLYGSHRVNSQLNGIISPETCPTRISAAKVLKNPGSISQTGSTQGLRKAYGTRYSQAVTHPSTNRARRCLTSVIRREPVYSTWYGRRQREKCKMEGRDKYKDSFDGLFHCISITAVIV